MPLPSASYGRDAFHQCHQQRAPRAHTCAPSTPMQSPPPSMTDLSMQTAYEEDLGELVLQVWGTCPPPWGAACCPGATPEAGAEAHLFCDHHYLCWILQHFRESAPVPTRSLLAEWAVHETKCAAAFQRKSDRELSEIGVRRAFPGSGRGDSAPDTDPGARPVRPLPASPPCARLSLGRHPQGPAGQLVAPAGGLEGHDRPPRVRPALVTPRPSCTWGVWLQPGSVPLQKRPEGQDPRPLPPRRRPRRKGQGGKREKDHGSAAWGFQGPRAGSGDPEGCLRAEERRNVR
ncbi:unnamed protein product [Rangifer tarandus platyrhynchus]|uniref:Uncharacterized protein n=3 Tax=Rangifer tarandus platyrhynchus TaxID=3082113 RepID=A0AC59ZMC1_RANTA|nr:unnamed protein product [Rangifer tarandus platyrhynchus]CAI9706006.1 unnamed protein product [Rangifer tarandus platyrhynchus]